MSYLRFVAFERPGPNGASDGPFALAYRLAKDQRQPHYYRRWLRQQLDWFGDYLPVPDRFERRLGRTSRGVGVCWFKPGAKGHIDRMREMCHVLDEIGHPIVCYRTDRPGLTLYEDAYQIVACGYRRQAHED